MKHVPWNNVASTPDAQAQCPGNTQGGRIGSGLESADYVSRTLALWRGALPLSMMVVEFSGHGDPAFGGSADDRLLGPAGEILPRNSVERPAEFLTIGAAHEAAKSIANRRADSLLGVLPRWR